MTPPSTPLAPDRYRRQFVIVLTIVISVLFLFVVRDFLMVLLLAGIFAGLLHPVYRRFLAWFRGRKAAASSATLVLAVLVVGLPLLALLGVVVAQAVRVSETGIAWAELHLTEAELKADEARLMEHLHFLDGVLPAKPQLLEAIGKRASELGGILVHSLGAITTGTATLFLKAFVMLYAMYGFLINGPEILRKSLFYLPLSKSDKETILARFLEVSRATIKGSLVIGFVQGLLGGIGFHFAGIEGAAFWGTIMMVLSVIPGIGTPLVWVPAVVILFARGETMPSVLLLTWSALVVSSVDNFLRPVLVGKDAGLPNILILVGTLGGIFLFGPVGFIVGPIICALCITSWQIYGVAFQDALGDEEPSRG